MQDVHGVASVLAGGVDVAADVEAVLGDVVAGQAAGDLLLCLQGLAGELARLGFTEGSAKGPAGAGRAPEPVACGRWQTNAAAPAIAADIMRPPLTTVEQSDHIAAAACLMKHAGTTALMVLDARTGQPAGIITEADIAHAVADGKDVNSTRIHDLMTARPTVISTTTSVRDAAKVMTSGHFRHLPVVGDAGLAGIVDITDVCRALLDPDVSRPPAGMAQPE